MKKVLNISLAMILIIGLTLVLQRINHYAYTNNLKTVYNYTINNYPTSCDYTTTNHAADSNYYKPASTTTPVSQKPKTGGTFKLLGYQPEWFCGLASRIGSDAHPSPNLYRAFSSLR
jgi:hypothetical protein